MRQKTKKARLFESPANNRTVRSQGYDWSLAMKIEQSSITTKKSCEKILSVKPNKGNCVHWKQDFGKSKWDLPPRLRGIPIHHRRILLACEYSRFVIVLVYFPLHIVRKFVPRVTTLPQSFLKWAMRCYCPSDLTDFQFWLPSTWRRYAPLFWLLLMMSKYPAWFYYIGSSSTLQTSFFA